MILVLTIGFIASPLDVHAAPETISEAPHLPVVSLSFVPPIVRPNYDKEVLGPLKIKEAQEQAQRDAVAAQEAAQALIDAQIAQQAAQQQQAVIQPVFTSYSTSGNGYTQCAGYAKSRRPDIPNNWGNASNWLYAAQSMGWSTGSSPRVGAVAWLIGGNHVAVVDAIYSNGTVLISEANWNGSTYDQRITPVSDWDYIY